MDNPNPTDSEKEIGNHVRLNIYRIPKNNHNALVENQKRFTNAFLEQGCNYQSFQLGNSDVPERFTSLADVVSASQDEEVWLDFESYRDSKQMDEVIGKFMKDERTLSLMKQYVGLLSPGSSIIRAELSRLNV
jgi:uncharacterized protein YbaA (DUF1428 family)